MAGLNDIARDAYDLFYQVTPITLVGGIAGNTPAGMLPIIATLGGLGGLAQGLLSGLATGSGIGLQDIPWRFIPNPGAVAVNQSVATYPFANRRIASNATVREPLSFSLQMLWPVNQAAGMLTKTALFSSLQAALVQHNDNGGTYTVATPAMMYPNCLLTMLQDVTPASSKQKQIIWQWDFYQPLLTTTQAAGALGGLMRILDGGGVSSSSGWSGVENSIGASVGSAVNAVETGVSGAISNIGNFASNIL